MNVIVFLKIEEVAGKLGVGMRHPTTWRAKALPPEVNTWDFEYEKRPRCVKCAEGNTETVRFATWVCRFGDPIPKSENNMELCSACFETYKAEALHATALRFAKELMKLPWHPGIVLAQIERMCFGAQKEKATNEST